MFGDTHLDNDTAEVSLDDELMEDFDTTDDMDDEDIEVSYTGEEETPAEDTNPQDEQTAEQQTESPAEQQQPAAETFTLKYKGQESQYTREQLMELASKGLDYDGVRADRDRLRDKHPALAIIDRYAKQANMTREQYMQFAAQKADEAEAAPQIKALMDSGVPEAAARELALRRLQETRAGQIQKQQQEEAAHKQTEAQKAEAQKQADYRALVDYANKNGIDLKELPQEVIRDIAGGMKPLEAYIRHENAQLRLKLSQHEQNQKNKQKNPGKVGVDAPAKVSDPFDDAFDDIFGL